MDLSPFLLARLQFAANITFHILFPTITIALSWVLLFFKIRFNITHDEKWIIAYKLWVKIFALSFTLGVVSGITMSFQFGTNWPGFMETVGNIAGPILGFEVLTAFFMEATFLGIMLYGMRRVPNWIHNFATLALAFSTTLSGFWILSLNSWMQTPRGYEITDGIAHVTNWADVIFNPTLPYMLAHMFLACFITVAFLLAGLSSYNILKGNKTSSVLVTQKLGIYLAIILLPTQMIVGDLMGIKTARDQPAKLAAIEGLWETSRGIPAIIFAIPNEQERKNYFEIGIPKLSSLLITHSLDGEVKGLNEFRDKHPPVAPVFWAFRIMLGTGMIMFFIAVFSFCQLRRNGELSKINNGVLVLLTFSGWIATVAGWYVTEIGRQPYLVYNLLKTKDAVSNIAPNILGSTLLVYLITYFLLLFSYVYALFYMARKHG
ncbi:MAG: cytochrome ubiquinol oxidase subunit I [Legionellales bacterium]|nr:cytochrome ubiquinol oxidase subunit I [Legionellales bacterium]